MTAFAGEAILSLFFHGSLVSVIGVGVPRFDQLKTIFVQLIKVVARIADLVGSNTCKIVSVSDRLLGLRGTNPLMQDPPRWRPETPASRLRG